MTDTPRNNAPKTRGRPFQPGNPGRPKGARHKATIALETLLGSNAEDVARAVIDRARQGDTAAARLVLERVLPVRRDQPIAVDLPAIDSPAGLLQASQSVVDAVGRGDITPNEGDALMGLLGRHRQIIETADHETRISELERKKGQ